MESKDTIIRSKIMKPALPRNFLRRDRLLHTLSAMEEPLVMLNASMGYGKTVAAAHMVEQCGGAWYHLDDTDNDIMVFGRYFIRALTGCLPNFEMDFNPYLAMVFSQLSARNLALDCVEALYQVDAPKVRMVLDDFHVITNDLVLCFLTTLIEHLDGGLQLFICSKSAMPSAFARLVVSQRAVFLSVQELAFTQSEIYQLASTVAPTQAPEPVAERLHSGLEGWPAGVMSALLHLRAGGQEEDFDVDAIADLPHMREYFMHELFRKLPFDLQYFLTRTAVLEYLQPEVCNVLTGRNDALDQLHYLEQENLFVIRTSGTHRFYRYHSLFRQFLCTLSTVQVQQELCQKAAEYYLGTDSRRWAVEYAISSGNGALLQRTVEVLGASLLEYGESDTLCHCLEALRKTNTAPSNLVLLLTGWYNQRLYQWQTAYEYAIQVLNKGDAKKPGRDQIEAMCLLATIARAHLSVVESEGYLETVLPILRQRPSVMYRLYRAMYYLHVYNLLDWGRPGEALAIVESDLAKPTPPGGAGNLPWMLELKFMCLIHLGHYHALRAIGTQYPMEKGSISEQYAYFLPAFFGQLPKALSQLAGQLENTMMQYAVEGRPRALLRHDLVMVLAEMEGLDVSQSRELSHELWTYVDVQCVRERSPRAVELMLKKAIDGDETQEVALFDVSGGTLGTMRMAVQWLWVHRLAKAGKGDEVSRLSSAMLKIYKEGGRLNAFTAFMAVEWAQVQDDVAAAKVEIADYLDYIQTQGLVMPGAPKLETAQVESPQESQWLEVTCFGKLRVTTNDGTEIAWRTRKTKELFAYLYHRKGQTVTREQIMDILWPQSTAGNATSLFHTSLYNIRKALNEYPSLSGLIRHGKNGYTMEPSLVRGQRQLLDGLDAGTLVFPQDMEPENLYTGAYLEDVEGAWCADARAHYSGVFLRTYRTLAVVAMDRGEYRRAVSFLRPATAQEPYDESLAGLLIQAYTALGEMKNTMAVYARLKAVLKEELGVEPGAEVTSVYRQCLLKRLERGRDNK